MVVWAPHCWHLRFMLSPRTQDPESVVKARSMGESGSLDCPPDSGCDDGDTEEPKRGRLECACRLPLGGVRARGPEWRSTAPAVWERGEADRCFAGAALAGLGDVHVERFDTGDGPPAIEPNQLAPYLYLIGSKVT